MSRNFFSQIGTEHRSVTSKATQMRKANDEEHKRFDMRAYRAKLVDTIKRSKPHLSLMEVEARVEAVMARSCAPHGGDSHRVARKQKTKNMRSRRAG